MSAEPKSRLTHVWHALQTLDFYRSTVRGCQGVIDEDDIKELLCDLAVLCKKIPDLDFERALEEAQKELIFRK